jgi:dTDP-glucose 4,6-dehydratase
MDNLITGNADNLKQHFGNQNFEFIHHDVSNHIHVRGGLDWVLHLASPASPIDYLQLPIQTLKVGALGTHNALGLAKANGAKFLLTSTSEVYGDPLVHPQQEDYWGNVNPIGPRGVYDEAKRFAEAVTMAYRGSRGVNTAIVRIFNTYGPRMRPHDGRAIPTFIDQALRGRPMTVSGDGSQTRSVCFVDDLIDGLVRMMHSEHPGPINLGNPQELTMLELATTVRDLTGSRSPISFVPRPVDDPSVRRPDITLARSALGWEPAVSVADGLLRTIDWFGQHSPRGQDAAQEISST